MTCVSKSFWQGIIRFGKVISYEHRPPMAVREDKQRPKSLVSRHIIWMGKTQHIFVRLHPHTFPRAWFVKVEALIVYENIWSNRAIHVHILIRFNLNFHMPRYDQVYIAYRSFWAMVGYFLNTHVNHTVVKFPFLTRVPPRFKYDYRLMDRFTTHVASITNHVTTCYTCLPLINIDH